VNAKHDNWLWFPNEQRLTKGVSVQMGHLSKSVTANEFAAEIDAIERIDAVPRILEVVCRSTGMGFAAIARVTDDRWVCCAVRDEIAFGLKPGGELRLETTICNQIRQSHQAVVIEHVDEDGHHTPAMYGFQSYVSVPIVLADESMFGTLCAIDPRPARLKNPETLGMFKLFAELVAAQLNSARSLAASEAVLLGERQVSELREQFIAVLGHDLRNPLASIAAGARIITRSKSEKETFEIAALMQATVNRMSRLIDNVLDFARGRLGGGLTLQRNANEPVGQILNQVVAELRSSHLHRTIETKFDPTETANCDGQRIGQLFSNLLGNAITHGSPEKPIVVRAKTEQGTFELSVANSGDPIPPSAMKQLFHPFYRGTVKQSLQGLGLGLYIASEIARAHGGTLDVNSSADETCFTFRMPST
jgi:signal transduction histidine kinase